MVHEHAPSAHLLPHALGVLSPRQAEKEYRLIIQHLSLSEYFFQTLPHHQFQDISFKNVCSALGLPCAFTEKNL